MEAQIVAQAGRYKAVTIATNMAGRGTDILLGGNPEFMAKNIIKEKLSFQDPNYEAEFKKLKEELKEKTDAEHQKVVALGGLHVLGTERHEARRIDNQLRGRSGRQGDPGSSRFYISLEDDLMRLFGSERLIGIMDKLGLEKGQVIEHPWITKSIEVAQKRIEQHNFEIRKQLLEYDNVMNKQREVIYGWRRRILEGESLKEEIIEIMGSIVNGTITSIFSEKEVSDLDLEIEKLKSNLKLRFSVEIDSSLFKEHPRERVFGILSEKIIQAYEEKERNIGIELMRHLERMVFLQIIDSKWKEHLYMMDNLREGIGLRAYGQRDPLIEYKREAFSYFEQMVANIEDEAVETIFKLQARQPERLKGVFVSLPQELIHPEAPIPQEPTQENINQVAPPANFHKPSPIQSSQEKVGRNDPCPCGSGKKYKKCCGR
jgi:preprotein translocase subunit SecA